LQVKRNVAPGGDFGVVIDFAAMNNVGWFHGAEQILEV
jgi:hypothetical protein